MTDYDNPFTSGTDPTSELTLTFAGAARALFVAGGTEATLQAIVDLAVATVDACDFAGILILEDGRLTPVHTDPIVVAIDALQVEAQAGPGLDAIAGGEPTYAEDLAIDGRWPDFGGRAAALGARSLLVFHVSADGVSGALSLYARYPTAFGAVDRAKGLVLAGLADVALFLAKAHEDDARQTEHLRHALSTRALVGQAQGILMERERISAEQAFDILRRASQHLNVKLREVAQNLIDTGERPPTGRAQTGWPATAHQIGWPEAGEPQVPGPSDRPAT